MRGARPGATTHPGIIVGQVPTGVGGDEHAVVADVQQAVDGLDDHALAGEVPTDVVAVGEDADPPGAIDPSVDRVAFR